MHLQLIQPHNQPRTRPQSFSGKAMGTRLLQSAISQFSTIQMYGGPLVSLRSRRMKVIWAQTTRHARYTRVSPSRAPFFLAPRYHNYLHAPVTQLTPLPK